MTVKEYVLRRLDQGETDLNVLIRQTRIQFPSLRITFNYVRSIRNGWQKASAARCDKVREPGSVASYASLP